MTQPTTATEMAALANATTMLDEDAARISAALAEGDLRAAWATLNAWITYWADEGASA